MSASQQQIFISYRRDDGGFGRNLYEQLSLWLPENSLFLDYENLQSGKEFRPQLKTAIQNSDTCLVVMGPHWLSEKNQVRLHDPEDVTRQEIETAIKEGLTVMSVLCGGASVPDASQLPESLQSLLADHLYFLHETDYRSSINRLLAQLKQLEYPIEFTPPEGINRAYHLGDIRRSDYFIDPDNQLERLQNLLHNRHQTAIVSSAALHGMGGVGKTQLALKFCEQYRLHYVGIWWFRAETLQTFEQDCKAFCSFNTLVVAEGEQPHQTINRFLETQPRWLLVYDNAEPQYPQEDGSVRHLRPLLPAAHRHHLIITARSPSLATPEARLALDCWTAQQAQPFLQQRLPQASIAQLHQLTATLDGLPLALEQACAYILQTGISIEDYCRAVTDNHRAYKLLDKQAALENGYQRSVLATLSMALEKLSPAARELLKITAWAAPEPLPEQLLLDNADWDQQVREGCYQPVENEDGKPRLNDVLLPDILSETLNDSLDWLELLQELENLALIQRVEIDLTVPGSEYSKNGQAILLHRLTQAAIRHSFAQQDRSALLIQLLYRYLPEDMCHPENWPVAKLVAPHIQYQQIARIKTKQAAQQFGWLVDHIASWLQFGEGLVSQAYSLFKQNLEYRTEVVGEDHPDTLTSINNLAVTLKAMGDHSGAKARHEEELACCRKVLGEDHLDTLTSRNNLAQTLLAMGDHSGAKAHHEHVLARRQTVLGEDHPDTLNSINNLAETLRVMGDYSCAKEHQEHVLARCRKVLGEDHPHTLISINNLALTLKAMGDHSGAKALEERVLARRQAVLGETHPDTIVSAWNLFLTLLQMDNQATAHDIFQQYLQGLLEVDETELTSADVRQIREQLIMMIMRSMQAGENQP
ncbi:MAG: toll/interleukin-1 receptor domain-containing protein [Marinobacterium sp.]|nr:toll/interleukin-1 receptor domain-containing protein [Marinobacterium sp.]